MEHNVQNASKKSAISIVLFISAIIVAILGVALLVNNIYLYKTSFSQAVAQGYAAATVRKALVTSQLLPGLFQPIALYGGIAVLLIGVSKACNKISNCLALLSATDTYNDGIQNNGVDQVDYNDANVENRDVTNSQEISDDTEKI